MRTLRLGEPSALRSPRRIAVLLYPGLQALDAVGPLEVFAGANALARACGEAAPYAIELVAPKAGPQVTESGYALVAPRAYASLRGPIDTLLVVGGDGSRVLRGDRSLRTWLRRVARRVRRLCSVCTGALILADAGLLDGRRVTTHWASCEHLQARHPAVHVERDPIFVRDGSVYTSAGVTAGIDLALALVEDDLGAQVARTIARWLVVFLQRPGGQAQFSVQLAAQAPERDAFSDLLAYIAEHPSADLSVATLARRVGMSPRNFARRFVEQVGGSPGQFVQRTRVEHARRQLEQHASSVVEVAQQSGFGTEEALRRAFVRHLKVAPSGYRKRFARARAALH